MVVVKHSAYTGLTPKTALRLDKLKVAASGIAHVSSSESGRIEPHCWSHAVELMLSEKREAEMRLNKKIHVIWALDRLNAHEFSAREKEVLLRDNVAVVSIPGQMTKYLQPCDTSLFGPLKMRRRRRDQQLSPAESALHWRPTWEDLENLTTKISKMDSFVQAGLAPPTFYPGESPEVRERPLLPALQKRLRQARDARQTAAILEELQRAHLQSLEEEERRG